MVVIALRWLRGRRAAAAGGGVAGQAPRRSLVAGGGLRRLGQVRDHRRQRRRPGHEPPLLARPLPKHDFVATGAWFFFVVNLLKLPIYAGHGLIDRRSLLFDLRAGAVGASRQRCWPRGAAGRLPQATFDRLVMALTVCAATLLFCHADSVCAGVTRLPRRKRRRPASATPRSLVAGGGLRHLRRVRYHRRQRRLPRR